MVTADIALCYGWTLLRVRVLSAVLDDDRCVHGRMCDQVRSPVTKFMRVCVLLMRMTSVVTGPLAHG